MKLTNIKSHKRNAGMTLLELTVVILVLLSLISILFIGARAWKKGSDRAGCILNIRNSQQAVRGYMNMHADAVPAADGSDTFGANSFLKNPTCPSDSTHTYATSYTFTPGNAALAGTNAGASLVLSCLIDTATHKPDGDLSQW